MSRDSDDLTTQPTATALMERVQQVEVRLAQGIDKVGTRLEGQMSSLKEEIMNSVQGQMSSLKDEIVNSVQGQISLLQGDMAKSFQRLNDRFLSLIEDILDVRANQRTILKRLNDLEITAKTS
ncbi:MAG TPA: hypothetical protein VLE20_07205 [Blastocatellia bacterium]|nr:hypothetical protein [Blastocatellia bacterium]